MSLKSGHIVIALLLAGLPTPAAAQVFTENGMTSGAGMAYLPTPGMVPMAHWRVNYARVDYLKRGLRGMNVFGMEYGLSSNIGGYVRLTGEQLGTVSSLSSFGFGLKALIPLQAPLVNATGVWFETTTTDDIQRSSLFPARTTRGGLTLSFGGYSLNPVILAGVNSLDGGVHLLAGGGITAALGSGLQIGIEAMRGYSEERSVHVGMDITLRVFPHVAILANPGYLKTSTERTWMLSFGIALSTADVDFKPSAATLRRDDFTLPSLEDIMKESSEEKKQ